MTAPAMILGPRFRKKVAVHPEGCWEWIGAKIGNGYGNFWSNGRQVLAHRFAYQTMVGPIPDGFQLDHLCRNRSCVNPAHLEVVTQRVNILRGDSQSARNARKTHCLRGHPLSGGNLYVPPRGVRVCRTCSNALNREYYAKKKAA